MIFRGRQSSVEDDLWWKTTFSGRRPPGEDVFRWKTTFGGRRLLVEEDPCMLPSPLCGIFDLQIVKEHTFLPYTVVAVLLSLIAAPTDKALHRMQTDTHFP